MKKAFLRILTVVLFSLICTLALEAKTYIVAVGISDYPGTTHDLKKCAYDAASIKNLFENNANATVTILTDERATASNIIQAMNKTFAAAKENDIIIFYFSGHGYKGGFAPYSGDLDYAAVRKAMAKSKAKNKMMFVDACFSGKIRTPKKSNSSVSAAKKAKVMLFLSSRPDETSLEMSTFDNGLFTHFLLKGLKGEADKNKDNIITARELYLYVHPNVINASSQRQHPQMWGDFPDNMPVMRW